MVKHLISALKELKSHGIIHRDIKPSNILLNDGVPKIADFGFSRLENNKDKIYFNAGTPLYMSPEFLIANKYSYKSDAWALGVSFF